MKLKLLIIIFTFLTFPCNSQENWSSWRSIDCGNFLQLKYRKGDYNKYANKWKWYVKFKNTSGKKIHFSIGGGRYRDKGNIKITDRLHAEPFGETGSWFLIADQNAVWFPVDNIRLGDSDSGNYVDCYGNEIDKYGNPVTDGDKSGNGYGNTNGNTRGNGYGNANGNTNGNTRGSDYKNGNGTGYTSDLINKKKKKSERVSLKVQQGPDPEHTVIYKNAGGPLKQEKLNKYKKPPAKNPQPIYSGKDWGIKPPVTHIVIKKTKKVPSKTALMIQKQRENGLRYQQEQYRLAQERRQREIERLNEQREKQRLAFEQQQAEKKRLRDEQIRQINAQLEQNRRNSQALQEASDQTANNWANGNYIQGSQPLMNEFAKQGNKTGVIATATIGVGLKIWEVARENKARKEAEEKRRQEELRRQREIEKQQLEIQRKKDAILKAQKNKFNALANEIRLEKKDIINKRKQIIETKKIYKPTYNLKTENNSPIYFLFAEVDKDYDSYSENISFPNTIEVNINESPKMNFSSIIAVYPKSNGEFDFVKNIVNDIKSTLMTKTNTLYILYDWSDSYEDINLQNNQIATNASNANFIIDFPEIPLIDLEKENSSTDNFGYWNDNTKPDNTIQPKNNKKIDYWGENNKETPSKNKEIDYWNNNKKTRPDQN